MKKSCDSLLNCREEKVTLFTKKDYPIKECKRCGHRFTEVLSGENHLRNIYSDDYFYGGGEGYPNYLEAKESLYKAGKRYAKIVARHTQGRAVLDAGCAAGFILKGFDDQGWSCRGIEPNDTMAQYGRSELKLNITTGSLENYSSEQKFDLINLIQVIGHFYDIDKAMRNVTGLLNEQGLVLVESWNMKSLVARMMGKNWQEYSPPSVIHWFSTATLKRFFRYYGFDMIDSGRPSKKIIFKHAISLLDAKTPQFRLKKKMVASLTNQFGKLTIPYPPVDLKWYLFRKVN